MTGMIETEDGEATEVVSFAPGGSVIGIGLLGATGANYVEAEANRLLEIERRILAIEARLPPA